MPPQYAPLSAHQTWAAPPLVLGDWRDLSLAEALPLTLRALLRLGHPNLVKLLLDCWPTRVRAMRPTCYPGWVFAEAQVALPDGTIGLINFLYGNAAVRVLDGTAPPLHTLNETGALKIENIQQAADYMRFFCSAVHGEEGRFMLLESVQTVYGRGRPPAGVEKPPESVLSHVTPLTVESEDGGYRGTAVMRYGGHVFRVKLRLRASGELEMTDDEPIDTLEMQPEVFRPPFWIIRVAPSGSPPDVQDEAERIAGAATTK